MKHSPTVPIPSSRGQQRLSHTSQEGTVHGIHSEAALLVQGTRGKAGRQSPGLGWGEGPGHFKPDQSQERRPGCRGWAAWHQIAFSISGHRPSVTPMERHPLTPAAGNVTLPDPLRTGPCAGQEGSAYNGHFLPCAQHIWGGDGSVQLGFLAPSFARQIPPGISRSQPGGGDLLFKPLRQCPCRKCLAPPAQGGRRDVGDPAGGGSAQRVIALM